MDRPALARRTLRVRMQLFWLLSILILLVMGCGEPPEEPKPRPLPEDTRELAAGTYRTEEFEPSFSFTLGEGWTNFPPEASDDLALAWGQDWLLRVVNPKEVYEPTKQLTVVEAPEDLTGWHQRHPYLRTSKPEPVSVGGIEGERFDVVVGDIPEGYSGACGSECVDMFRISSGDTLGFPKGYRIRLTILEDVKGETVSMGFGGPTGGFDLLAADSQKVIDSIEWTDE